MHHPYVRRALLVSSALAVLAAPAAAAAAPHHARQSKSKASNSRHPRRGAGYVGSSSQKAGKIGLPVDLRVSPNGQIMSRFDIQWASACTSATGKGSYGGLSVTQNKKIAANGTFGDSGSFTRDFGGGSKGLFTVLVTGHFNSPQSAAGTFRVTVAVTDAAGHPTDNCDSGTIGWSVSD